MSRSMFSSRSRRTSYGTGRSMVWLWLVLAIVLVGIDRLTKLAVAANMRLYQDIPVLGNFLHLYYLRNTGAAFSLFDNLQYGRWLLVGVTTILVVACIWALLSGKVRARLSKLALSLIIAGGIGNLIDRVCTGEVIDFLYVKIIHFAIFNAADCFVVVGAILFCLSLLLSEGRSGR